jgi:hypothetical protein
LIDTSENGFVQWLKKMENAKLLFHDLNYLRHPSPEGGNDTIGYGHKLTALENDTNQVYGYDLNRLLYRDAEVILCLDLKRVEDNLAQLFSAKWDTLGPRRQQMLLDMQYNLGDVRGKFPKFTEGVLTNNLDVQRAEYKRYYKDAKGRKHELERRNRGFYDRFLSSAAIDEWAAVDNP